MKKLYVDEVDSCFDCPEFGMDEDSSALQETVIGFCQKSSHLKNNYIDNPTEVGAFPAWCELPDIEEGKTMTIKVPGP